MVPVTRQYVYTHDARLWRLPTGGMEPEDADPAAAARRELREQTALTAGCWRSLGTVHGADSATDHRDHAFLATDLTAGTPEPGPGEADLEVEWLPFARVLDLVTDGQLAHAASAFAVLTVALRDPRWSARRAGTGVAWAPFPVPSPAVDGKD
ncbi:MAG TPA: NUDIX domain-containing protein [Pseudonocardiaceae bacterium]